MPLPLERHGFGRFLISVTDWSSSGAALPCMLMRGCARAEYSCLLVFQFFIFNISSISSPSSSLSRALLCFHFVCLPLLHIHSFPRLGCLLHSFEAISICYIAAEHSPAPQALSIQRHIKVTISYQQIQSYQYYRKPIDTSLSFPSDSQSPSGLA